MVCFVKIFVLLDWSTFSFESVHIWMYVDSDHAGEKRTRRSRSGFFVLLNYALVQWLSKKQPTTETSVFGAEFVAMRIRMESLRGLRYKLRMMGVPIWWLSLIYGDNMSVIHNTQQPESTLKKKQFYCLPRCQGVGCYGKIAHWTCDNELQCGGSGYLSFVW